ncbi:Zinc finger protein [Spatholobus suberectus]|nr:Zinc finger protein [Spatholobus suberectus]
MMFHQRQPRWIPSSQLVGGMVPPPMGTGYPNQATLPTIPSVYVIILLFIFIFLFVFIFYFAVLSSSVPSITLVLSTNVLLVAHLSANSLVTSSYKAIGVPSNLIFPLLEEV